MSDRRLPLVGRDEEQALLVAAIEAARDTGTARAVTIEGEAGMGAAALVDLAADAAAERGFTVLRASGNEETRDRPLDTFLAAGWPLSATPDVDEVVALVETSALRAPVLVAVERLHWVDATTVDAITEIARRLRDLPVVVVATLRRITVAAADALVAEVVAGGGMHLVLPPLEDDDIAALVAAHLGLECGPRLVAACARAGGNPVATLELVHALQRDGRIVVQDGVAEVEGGDLPESFRDAFLRRIELFGRDAVDALQVAAVLGEHVDVGELALVLGRSVPDVLDDLARPITTEVLQRDGSTLRFQHALLRDALEQALPRPVRSALHAEVATVLASTDAARERVARHLLAAGGAAPTGVVVDTAWALRKRAPVLVLELCDRALDDGRVGAEEREALRAAMAWPLVAAGRSKEAEAIATQLLGRGARPDLDADLAHCLVAALQRQGRFSAAHDELVSILARPGLANSAHRALETRLPLARLLTGDVTSAVEGAEALIERARAAGDVESILNLLIPLVLGADAQGDVARALALAEEIERLRTTTAEPQGGLAIVLPALLLEADRFDEARSLRAAAATGPTVDADPALAIVSDVWEVLIETLAGRWDDALAAADAVREATARRGAAALIPLFAMSLPAVIHLHRGALDEAESCLDEAERTLETSGAQIGADLVLWGRARLLEAKGCVEDAAALLAAEWEFTAAARYFLSWRLVAPDLVRLALATGDIPLAERVTVEAEEGAERAGEVPSATGAALRCRAQLEREADVALEAAAVLGLGPRRPDYAAACEEAGVLLVTAGRHDEAVAAFVESRAAFDALGARRDLARVDDHLVALDVGRGRRRTVPRPVSGWASLTPRELEVTELVAAGLTNPQVAARLFLSRHTVESHLKRIFTKLGVSSRTQLVAEAAGRGRNT